MAAPVFVGLSGGVDSAIAAWRLQQSGVDVEALFMKNWEEDDTESYCSAAADLEDAQQICQTLGLPLHTVNFATEYWDRVFKSFLAEYEAGRTPNPDIACNREIKFRAFLDHARQHGAQAIATGHYAGIRRGEQPQLIKAADTDKDQTYFLCSLDAQQLEASHFPLADLQKSEVRKLAQHLGLSVHDKKDSTGICFIGERRFQDFLARYIKPTPGLMLDPEGRTLGEHSGLAFYTLGQRTGLGIGGVAQARGAPWYVMAKDPMHNTLILTQDRDHPRLQVQTLELEAPHWVAGTAPTPELSLTARIRHRQLEQICRLQLDPPIVHFEVPQWAPTPGQSVVFYAADVCLGGAVIRESVET